MHAVTTTVRALAALLTGFAAADELVRAGPLDGLEPTGLEASGAAFAGPRPRPSTSELH